MNPETEQATCAIALPGGAPEWVHLMPLGNIEGRDGRKWTLRDAAAVIQTSMARAIDLVIDYEHQTDFAKDNGRKAPAAGWIKDLQARPDGIWGRVEWTGTAAEHLEKKEYRFLSPTFLFNRKTREVGSILRAALTNAPALYLTALATRQDTQSMDELLKALAATLGLPEDADQETALAKVSDLVKDMTTADETVTAIRMALQLDDKAGAEDIKKALAKAAEAPKSSDQDAEPDPSKFVPIEEYQKATARISALEDGQNEGKARDAVTDGMRAGKIAPSQEDWALGFAKKDLVGFQSFLESQPVIVKPGSELPGGKPARTDGALSDEDKAVCNQLGLNESDFKKTREMEVAQ